MRNPQENRTQKGIFASERGGLRREEKRNAPPGPACYHDIITIQELNLHHKQRPFEPFRLLVADGRSCDVRHPERLASLRTGRMVSVATDDGFVILDLLLVTGLEKSIPKRKPGTQKRAS